MVNNILTTKNEVTHIEAENLYTTPLNNGFPMDDISEVQNSLERCGLLEPLTVTGPDNDGKYEILSGNRRYVAIQEIRKNDEELFQKIPCYVIAGADDLTSNEKRLLIEEANIRREGVDQTYHRGVILRLMREIEKESKGTDKEETVQDIMARSKAFMKLSPRYRLMYLNVFDEGNEDVEELIKEGKVTLPQADKIIHMEDEEKKKVSREIKEGKKAKEVLEPYVKKRAPKEEKSVEDLPPCTPENLAKLAEMPYYPEEVMEEPVEDEEVGYLDKEKLLALLNLFCCEDSIYDDDDSAIVEKCGEIYDKFCHLV